MKFKPFSAKYHFSKETLIRNFPDFILLPLRNWFTGVLQYTNFIRSGYLTDDFRDRLQLFFREIFPQTLAEMLSFVLRDVDRTTNFIAFCLQNAANQDDADILEYILSQSGSAYQVVKIDKVATNYERGVYDLIERVQPAVKQQSEKALNQNDQLQEAWLVCYSRNPDYEKVVSRCSDFLEGFLGKLYFPKDPKPQLKKFVHSFENTPTILNYKGSSIVSPKSHLTSLLKEASNIRGQHTNGQGRKPTKQEAEFVLHTTIYIWNLHQK